MAGRLQPREAEAFSGEARCERDACGSPDWREIHFTAAKLSLVQHHHLGAFRCSLLPCSLFRRHSRSLPFLAIGAPSLGIQKGRHFSLSAATTAAPCLAARLRHPHLDRDRWVALKKALQSERTASHLDWRRQRDRSGPARF